MDKIFTVFKVRTKLNNFPCVLHKMPWEFSKEIIESDFPDEEIHI